jgi:hypothetical protein
MSEQETVKQLIRLPKDVKAWLERKSAHNISTQTAEIVRSVRERMQREAAVR